MGNVFKKIEEGIKSLKASEEYKEFEVFSQNLLITYDLAKHIEKNANTNEKTEDIIKEFVNDNLDRFKQAGRIGKDAKAEEIDRLSKALIAENKIASLNLFESLIYSLGSYIKEQGGNTFGQALINLVFPEEEKGHRHRVPKLERQSFSESILQERMEKDKDGYTR